MKIGIDAHWLGSKSGGGETYIENLLNALANLDQKNYFRVYITKRVLNNKIFLNPYFEPSLIPEFPIIRNLFSFPRELKKGDLDLFHAIFPFPLKIYGKFIVTIHDISFEGYPQFFTPKELSYFRMIRYLIYKAERIIAISEYTKEEIIKHYRIQPEKITVIYAGVEEIFKPIQEREVIPKGLSKYKIMGDYLLYVGRLNIRKNLSNLFRAYAALKVKERLVVVGEQHGKGEDIRRLIREFSLNDRVIFTGYIPKEDLPILYNGAKGFIYVPIVEGFGLPALEAMACGAPCIVSNTSSLPEVAGDAAIMVNPLDIEEIQLAIVSLLKNSSLRDSLSKKGIERAKLFSWATTAEKTIKVYEEVANKSR